MRLVQQEDMKGCGVAAVAMVTGYSYGRVRVRALRGDHWRASYGMNGAMLQRMLRSMGRPVQRTSLRGTHGRTAVVKVTGLVPVGRTRNRLWMHWVVWHRGKVYDPSLGIVWDGNGAVDGMELYLASCRIVGMRSFKARTGRWHWVQA